MNDRDSVRTRSVLCSPSEAGSNDLMMRRVDTDLGSQAGSHCEGGPFGDGKAPPSTWESFSHDLGLFSKATKVSIQFTLTELRARTREYVIGMLAVLIVVSVSSMILYGTQASPILFVKLAEEQTGELDMMMLANMDHSGSPFLNFTDRALKLAASPNSGTHVTPRWYVTAEARKKWPLPFEKNRTVGCTVMIIDSFNENRINLGRTWSHRRLGESEAHVKDTLLRQLGIRAEVGDHIVIEIDLQRFADDYDVNTDVSVNGFGFGVAADALGIGEQKADAAPAGLPVIRIDLDVVSSISSPEGKYPAAVGNAVLIDSRFFLRTIVEQICYHSQRKSLGDLAGFDLPEMREIAKSLKLNDRALTVQALFEGRRDIYTQDTKEMQRVVVNRSDELVLTFGDRVNDTLEYPLPQAMLGFSYLRLFLDQIFNCIVITIIILGCILIYSLLLANISKKTYEHGMLRALGFRKVHLINLISVQAFTFSVPGVVAAVFVSLLGQIIIEHAMSDYSGFSPQYGKLTGITIGIPIAIGFIVPFASNIIPIKRALGKSLRGALDISHQAASDTQVTLQKLEDMGLEVWQTCLALFLVVAGFVVYYLMPYSFIFDELWLFFFILLAILMSMLFGLCIISMTLQSTAEEIFLNAFLWGGERKMKAIILKNLSAHRARSSKTFIMFAISTASIIFGGVVFSLQAESIGNNIRIMVGSDVQIRSVDFDEPLPRDEMEAFLQRKAPEYPALEAWSFATFPLMEYPQVLVLDVANMLNFPLVELVPQGIDSRFYESIYEDFFVIEEKEDLPRHEIVRSLSSKKGVLGTYRPPVVYSGVPLNRTIPDLDSKYEALVPVITSYAAKEVMSLDSETMMRFLVVNSIEESTAHTDGVHYLAKPRALITKLPGWLFGASSYSFLLKRSPLLMSIDSFQRILNDVTGDGYAGKNVTNYQKAFIKFKRGTPVDEREALLSEMKAFLHREKHMVLEAEELINSTKTAIQVLMVFFYSMSGATLFLNIFLLWVSFTDNVSQNQWVFAVMRSLGFSCDQLVRAFIYEALSTVMSAFLFGSLIGITIAVTLTAQYNMFLEMPINMQFPWGLFFTVLIEALFSAVVGSWWPATVCPP